MPGRVLLVYGTNDGQTANIASHLAATLQEQGLEVELHDASVERPPGLRGATAVLVGASLRWGHYQRSMERWVRAHRGGLAAVPNAFFGVSISAARQHARAQNEVQKSVARLAEATGWTPARAVAFGGALKWTRYPLWITLMLLLLLKVLKMPETDTSRDYEFTDWTAVEAFARDFAASLRPAA